MRIAKALRAHSVLALLVGLCLSTATACGTDEVVQCTDICDELDSCFEDFDTTQCIDRCEDQSEAAIDTCNDCLDESEMECTDCTGAQCSVFIGGGMVLPPL